MDDRDLEQRLAGYRPVVERSMARRPLTPGGGREHRRWAVSAVAAATIAAGVVGWVALGGDEPSSTGSVPTTEGADVPAEISCRLPVDEPAMSGTPETTEAGDPEECVPVSCVTDGDPWQLLDPDTLEVVGTLPAEVPVVAPQLAEPPDSPANAVAFDCVSAGRNSDVAFGDSIMMGATSLLSEAGVTVDAHESRQFRDLVPTVVAMAGRELPSIVVIHVGNNGAIGPDDLNTVMSALADARRVVVLTSNLDRSWSAANNELIRALPAEYPNVIVLDWDVLAEHCAGDCFAADGFHLADDGAEYYAELITNLLNATDGLAR